METLNRVYYKIDGYDNLPTIQLSGLGEFEEMIDRYNPEFIFVVDQEQTLQSEEKDLIGRNKSVKSKTSFFSFYHNGLVYSVNGLNYESLEDYKEGQEKGYRTGDAFYKAKNGNFVDREEYENCINAGFDDRLEYLKAKAIGFEGAVNKLETAFVDGRLGDADYKKVKDYKNDAQVYAFAKELSYEGYDEFEKALTSGFVKVNAAEYRAAVEKGFDSSDSYFRAQQGQFDDINEYNAANSLGITDKDEYRSYKSLNALQEQYGFRSLEQANLYRMLKDLPGGKKVSVARMWDMLKEAEQNVDSKSSGGGDKSWFDTPILELFGKGKAPNWYSTSFKDIVEMKVFLISNEHINNIGVYDADGEVFERAGGSAEASE